ncbi:hypothetical protein VQ056_14510 [Paenibacillus sp. JTLBN-2024]
MNPNERSSNASMARTAVGKAKKGSLAQTRADDLGKAVLEAVVDRAPGRLRKTSRTSLSAAPCRKENRA